MIINVRKNIIGYLNCVYADPKIGFVPEMLAVILFMHIPTFCYLVISCFFNCALIFVAVLSDKLLIKYFY